MSKSTHDNRQDNGFLAELGRELRDLWRGLGDSWSGAGVSFRNQMRRMRHQRLDYIVMPVDGSLPERPSPPRSFWERRLPLLPPEPLSMHQLNVRLRCIADADNVNGVVLVFRGFTAGLATIQNFRRAVERLRASGKRCIVYTPYLDLLHYYAATAADTIIVPHGAQFDVLGLHADVAFYRDALAQVGVQMDVVQISPYKTAFDTFQHSDMTPQQREQLDWLLDDQFDMLTADMAAARSMAQEAFQTLIDGAPYRAEQALELGLVDHIAFEDELADLLAEQPAAEDDGSADTADSPTKPKRARLKTWRAAADLLTEKSRPHSGRYIGVLSLEGMITMGPSRQSPVDLPIPFLGSATAGEQTVVRLLRQIEKQQEMAALIFHVDSGGGSALASDLIMRELARIARKKPVLAYMGNVAASGGYYVAAPASHIMTQTGTTTGSIGVIMARLSTAGLYEKLRINSVQLQRGRHADLYTGLTPLTEEQYDLLWEGVVATYDEFKQVVADGRGLPFDELDPICEGRVWTGRQAAAHHLVDSHGDFLDAIATAAELAELDEDDVYAISVVDFFTRTNRYVLPRPSETVEALAGWFSRERLEELNGRPLLLMPFQLRLK